MKKRFLSILTALCLTLTLLPTAALAEENELPPAKNGVVKLDNNYSVDNLDPNTTYDLNGYTLTLNRSSGIVINSGETLRFMDSSATGSERKGTLALTGMTSVNAFLCPAAGGTVVAENITITSTGSAFYPSGSAAKVEITNCDVTASVYCVATNANGPENYGVVIELTDSTFTANSADGDNCPIMINVPGTLMMDRCEVVGDRQAVLVRAGEATITDCKITVTGEYSDSNDYENSKTWGSGNEVPMAALVVGSQTDAYKALADCTVTGTTINAPVGNTKPAVYVSSNKTGDYSARLEVSGASTTISGDIVVADGSEDANATVVVQDSATVNGGIKNNSTVSSVVVIDDATVKGNVEGDNVYVEGDEESKVVALNMNTMVPYTNLQDAIDAADSDDTIKLVANVEVDAYGIQGRNEAQALTIGKDLTINGQGQYTIKGKNFDENVRLITVTDSADVTFTNVTLDGNNTEGEPGVQGARHGLNLWNAGTVTLNNVTIKNCDWYAVANNGSNLIVNGLTTTGNAWGINLDNNATATINSASISESSSIVYENAGSGSLTVNGGTFQNVVVQAEEAEDVCGGRIDLKGGSFNDITTSGEGTYNDTSIVTVSGGTYHQNVSEYLADGLSWNPSTGAVYDPSQNQSSSGSSSDPSYSPILDVSDGGSIKVNPRTPEEDDEVTITVDPDSGYEVDEVTVTDRNGREVKVTAERNGTYTFTQPRGRVTISVTFVREGGSTFFSDVPESFWAYDEIAWAYDNGYVNGTSASSFSPNASISRQQVWMILARLSGADPANMSAAREWAVTNGVSDGTTPGGAVTRQQLVALLYRYATLMGYANDQRADLSAYPDAGTVAGYAVEPMQWSVANSIVGGTSNGTLDPTGTATRAQFAVILYRFWDQVG